MKLETLLFRRLAVFAVALSSAACSTTGVEREATQFARGSRSLDSALHVSLDALEIDASDAFVAEMRAQSAGGNVEVRFNDQAACTNVTPPRNASADACTLVFDDDPTESDEVDPSAELIRLHRSLVEAATKIQALSTAGSVSDATTALRNASFTARSTIAASNEAAENELDDAQSAVDDATDAVLLAPSEEEKEAAKSSLSKAQLELTSAADARDDVESMVAATNAGIELGEGLFADLFEWRLAVLRRKKVEDAVEQLVIGRCRAEDEPEVECGSPTTPLTRRIAKKSDAVLATLHQEAVVRLTADHLTLLCGLQIVANGPGHETNDKCAFEDVPTAVTSLDQAGASNAIAGLHARIAVSRSLVRELDRLERAGPRRIENCQPAGDAEPSRSAYLLSRLIEQYDPVLWKLRAVAKSPGRGDAAQLCLAEFEEKANFALSSVTRARQLLRARIDMEQGDRR